MPTLKPDTTLIGAVDLARAAAEEIAEPGMVGDHVDCVMEGERLATHRFVCLSPGYPDWLWSITVTRVSRSRHVTVSETHLLPGETSIVSPAWVPYEERIAPGDLGVGDVNPYVEDDPNLEAGFEATGDEDVDRMAEWELGLGRKRVLSPEGREGAAQRWYDGDNGPGADVAKQAPARCSTCGYFLPMAGALRRSFGVCANAWSPSDGRVVSLDHGCGAHSEVDMERPEPRPLDPPVVDDFAVDLEVLPADAPGDDRAEERAAAVAAADEAVAGASGADTSSADVADAGSVDDDSIDSGAPTATAASVGEAETTAVVDGPALAAAPEPGDEVPHAKGTEDRIPEQAVVRASTEPEPLLTDAEPVEQPAPRRRRAARRAAGAPAGPPPSSS